MTDRGKGCVTWLTSRDANTLLLSLNDEQRKAAVVRRGGARCDNHSQLGAAADNILRGNLEHDARRGTTGDPHATCRILLRELPGAIRADLIDQLARGEQSFHFAWFGPADPAKPHAFRIQGPTLLIDFNDRQDGANHIHTFYRSLLGDFGANVGR